jgi:hypothetical protein
MPGLGTTLTSAQIAQILSYTRRDWGHEAPIIETATVEKVRAATKDRGASWTAPSSETFSRASLQRRPCFWDPGAPHRHLPFAPFASSR